MSRLVAILTELMEKLSAERGCILTGKGKMVNLPEDDDFPFSRTLVDAVLDEGEPIITADACTDRSVPESTSILIRQVRSVICCPIEIDDDEAVVYIDSRMKNKTFSAEDLKLVQESFEGFKAG